MAVEIDEIDVEVSARPTAPAPVPAGPVSPRLDVASEVRRAVERQDRLKAD